MNLRPDVKLAAPDGRKGTPKTIVRHRTPANMADALDWAIVNHGDVGDCHSVSGASRFTGTRNAQAYADMLRDGWPEGVQDAEGLDGLSTDTMERLSFVRSVGGAFPLVPAYLAGAPDAMLMPTQQSADNVRGVTLIIDGGFPCSVDADDCLTYALSVMKLLAWLQAEQIETAVYIAICMRWRAGRYVYVIPVRMAGDILMPERIASLIHPSMLRRGWFAIVEYEHYTRNLKGTDMVESNYGYPSIPTADELRAVIPEAYSVIRLPRIGSGDPLKAAQESDTLKLRLDT